MFNKTTGLVFMLCVAAAGFCCASALANNMAVSNVSLEAGASGKRNIVFNLTTISGTRTKCPERS